MDGGSTLDKFSAPGLILIKYLVFPDFVSNFERKIAVQKNINQVLALF